MILLLLLLLVIIIIISSYQADAGSDTPSSLTTNTNTILIHKKQQQQQLLPPQPQRRIIPKISLIKKLSNSQLRDVQISSHRVSPSILVRKKERTLRKYHAQTKDNFLISVMI